MKKGFITALIVLISIALIGLFAIQIYWIKNSVALKDAQFRGNVKVSIAEFNHILEREEAKARMKKHKLGQKLQAGLDSIRKARPMASILVTRDNHGEDTALFISQSGEYAFKFDASRSTSRFFNSSFDEVEVQAEEEDQDSEIIFTDVQTELLTELVTSFFEMEMGSDFIGRHSLQSIDSLLRANLREVGGIGADFEFGIFDLYDEPLIITDAAQNNMQQLVTEGFRSRIFPSDLVKEPLYLRVWFPKQDSYLLKTLWPLLIASAIFMITVILAFGYTIRTILHQKKLSIIKNDFINNMTHELKTPISTISLACEALADPVMSKNETRVQHFLKMIREENKRLGVLVENVLKSAVLDRGEMKLNLVSVDIHEVIEAAIRNTELQANQKGGKIETRLEADKHRVEGDQVHLTNVIYNLLDNAIKYSRENPLVEVKTTSHRDFIEISVSDNGIGIKKDEQERIFEKLYRVHTGDVHDIKGFGLGLSYVKMIVEKHHGTVSVTSELGKGSTFTIQIPFDYDLKNENSFS